MNDNDANKAFQRKISKVHNFTGKVSEVMGNLPKEIIDNTISVGENNNGNGFSLSSKLGKFNLLITCNDVDSINVVIHGDMIDDILFACNTNSYSLTAIMNSFTIKDEFTELKFVKVKHHLDHKSPKSISEDIDIVDDYRNIINNGFTEKVNNSNDWIPVRKDTESRFDFHGLRPSSYLGSIDKYNEMRYTGAHLTSVFLKSCIIEFVEKYLPSKIYPNYIWGEEAVYCQMGLKAGVDYDFGFYIRESDSPHQGVFEVGVMLDGKRLATQFYNDLGEINHLEFLGLASGEIAHSGVTPFLNSTIFVQDNYQQLLKNMSIGADKIDESNNSVIFEGFGNEKTIEIINHAEVNDGKDYVSFTVKIDGVGTGNKSTPITLKEISGAFLNGLVVREEINQISLI